MAQHLQTITEQYAQMYQASELPERKSVTFEPKLGKGLKTNPSGLSISIVRKLSAAVSAKPPQTPAAGARGATCDLLDANFMALDVDTVRTILIRLLRQSLKLMSYDMSEVG